MHQLIQKIPNQNGIISLDKFKDWIGIKENDEYHQEIVELFDLHVANIMKKDGLTSIDINSVNLNKYIVRQLISSENRIF